MNTLTSKHVVHLCFLFVCLFVCLGNILYHFCYFRQFYIYILATSTLVSAFSLFPKQQNTSELSKGNNTNSVYTSMQKAALPPSVVLSNLRSTIKSTEYYQIYGVLYGVLSNRLALLAAKSTCSACAVRMHGGSTCEYLPISCTIVSAGDERP